MKAVTLKQALAALKRDVTAAMKDQLADEVREAHEQAVEEDVYGAYEPTVYQRRYDLANYDNIDIRVRNLTLTMENTTPPSSKFRGTVDKDLAEVIETGVGYDYEPHPGPRPFIQGTEDRLESSGQAENAVANGLWRRGWDVK